MAAATALPAPRPEISSVDSRKIGVVVLSAFSDQDGDVLRTGTKNFAEALVIVRELEAGCPENLERFRELVKNVQTRVITAGHPAPCEREIYRAEDVLYFLEVPRCCQAHLLDLVWGLKPESERIKNWDDIPEKYK